jgi:hypothetical protein
MHLGILFYIKIGKTIGKGTFGKVKLGNHNLTGEKVSQDFNIIIYSLYTFEVLQKELFDYIFLL